MSLPPDRNVASAENLTLSTVDDAREGAIVTKIAAHGNRSCKAGRAGLCAIKVTRDALEKR